MEAVGHRHGLQNGHWGRAQMPVQRLGQAEWVPVADKVGMGDLASGMNAGIRAPCGGNGVGSGLQPPQSLLDGGLHRRLARGLPLPALKG